MQPVAAKAHALGRASDVELGEHHFNPLVEIAANEASIPALVEALESSMAKAPYHFA